MTILKKYSKAIFGGISAALAAYVMAIQEVRDAAGMIVDSAWHVTGQEWVVVFGALVGGLGLVALSPANKR